jgi:hypothetical protein
MEETPKASTNTSAKLKEKSKVGLQEEVGHGRRRDDVPASETHS